MIITSEIHNILREWKAEAKISHVCLYGKGYGENSDSLMIYTDHPGPFIGKMGERHSRFEKRICEASYGTIKRVSYVETRGII